MADWDWSNFTNGDKIGNGFEKAFALGPYDPTNPDREALRNQVALGNAQGAAAGQFADTGQNNYGQQTQNLAQQTKYLQDLQSGRNSVAAEQLRQGLAQNVAAQHSMAAGGAPQNSAQAARIAANNTARLGYGMSGQQATAGLAERNAATQALTNAYLQQRGQDANVALQSRQNAINAYGQGSQAYGTVLQNPQKNGNQYVAGISSSLLGMASKADGGGGGTTTSDRRAKTDIEDGDLEASRITKGLKAYAFKYRDEKHGRGRQFGVMAQELERAGLKHTVIDTPGGKTVHGAKAATTSLALVAALGRRVEKLEGAKK